MGILEPVRSDSGFCKLGVGSAEVEEGLTISSVQGYSGLLWAVEISTDCREDSVLRYSVFLFLMSTLQAFSEPQQPVDFFFSYTPGINPSQGVWIAGEFNNWNLSSHSLEKQQNGSWTGTFKIPPGEYRYLVKVDDHILPQPLPLIVGQPWHLVDPLAPAGKAVKISVPNATGQGVSGWLYTPTVGTPSGLIILLHGNGGKSEDWIENGKMMTIADNLIHHKKIPPVAIFIPDLSPLRQNGLVQKTLAELPEKLEEFLPENIPQGNNALMGVSQGGAEVYRMLRESSSPYGAYAAIAGWWDPQTLQSDLTRFPENPIPLGLWCGSGDGLIGNAREVSAQARVAGLNWPLVEGVGGHNWECWNKLTPEILIWIALMWQKEKYDF